MNPFDKVTLELNRKITSLEEENAALKEKAECWRAIVAEAERDYVEVPSHEEPYWQRLECTEAMEEWADAAIAAAPKQEK